MGLPLRSFFWIFAVTFVLIVAPFASITGQANPASQREYWPTSEWRTAQPAEHGLDVSLLQTADQRFQTEWPLLSSVVAVHDGEIVFEGNYGGYQSDQALDIWSATKAFSSTAIGLAINDGMLQLNDTLGELIPERIPANADPRVQNVNVRHVLTMTSGFAWDSGTDYANVRNTDDIIGRLLSLPMWANPGDLYTYNSGNSHLLSVIVQAATGIPMADYLQTELFDPMGIVPELWETTPQGETLGSVGLYITPRDMAKLGYLFLNDGMWEGRPLVQPGWVTASTKTQVVPGPSDNLGNAVGYGYQWWIDEAAGYESYFALGYGEQVIYVVPDLDLVIVGAVAEEIAVQQLQYPRAIFEELIVPAAIGA